MGKGVRDDMAPGLHLKAVIADGGGGFRGVANSRFLYTLKERTHPMKITMVEEMAYAVSNR